VLFTPREHFPGKSESEASRRAKTLALAIAIVTLASDMPFLAGRHSARRCGGQERPFYFGVTVTGSVTSRHYASVRFKGLSATAAALRAAN